MAVSDVYTASVQVRHDEIDVSGRLHPAVYLRYLAQVAVEASTAAGFDAAWYAAAGALWIIRRSTFVVHRAITGAERVTIRTWVEDFRRVRSQRRYEVHGADGAHCLDAVTDWVFVDTASGRLRRVPEEMLAGFGHAVDGGGERPGWSSPPAPAHPATGRHRVGYGDIDSLGHVNNAAYLDLLTEATLDVFAACDWPLQRLIAENAVPLLVAADVEYLDEAFYGETLETRTWFSIGETLDAHQEMVRVGETRPLVRANTRWRWAEGAAGAAPPALTSALAAWVTA